MMNSSDKKSIPKILIYGPGMNGRDCAQSLIIQRELLTHRISSQIVTKINSWKDPQPTIFTLTNPLGRIWIDSRTDFIKKQERIEIEKIKKQMAKHKATCLKNKQKRKKKK